MSGEETTALRGYAGALAAIAAAVLLRWLLDPWMGEAVPLATLVAGVAVATWLGGVRAAILAAVLGFLAADYLFITPRHTLGMELPLVVGSIAYAVSCAVVIAVGNRLRRMAGEARATAGRLEESERRFRALQQNSPLALVVLRPLRDDAGRVSDFVWLYASPRAAAINARSESELLGRRLLELMPGARQSGLFEAYRKVAETGEMQDLVVRYDQDRVHGWFHNLAVPFEGNVAVWYLDVTARMQQERALEASRHRLTLSTEAAGLGVFEWVGQSDQTFWENERMFEIFGRRRDDGPISRRDFLACIATPEDLQRVREELAASVETRSTFRLSFPIRRYDDGEIRWVEVGGRFELDAEDKPVRLVGTVADVSARRQSEADRRALEDRLAEELSGMSRLHEISMQLLREGELTELLARILDAAVEITRSDGGVVQLVDPMKGLLQTAVQRRLGSTAVSDALRAWGCSREPRRLVVTDVNAERPGTLTDALIAAGARSVQATPLTSRSGRFIGLLATLRREPGRPDHRELRLLDLLARQAADLIERTQTERALRLADRRKDEFLATLAHELRNPLAPLLSASEFLRRDDGSDEARRRAKEIIERQIRHMARLVDDLLDVSRVTLGRIELRKEPVGLQELVEQAVEAARPMVEAGRHTLSVSHAPAHVWLDADPTRLSQVMVNLLSNAAKYTPSGGHIWLTTEARRDEAVIRVRDDGIGLPADMLTGVFELFTQVGTTGTSAGGLGLGLALVQRLVDLHGGAVTAHSEGPGTGSEFVVRLPARREAGEEARALPLPEPSGGGRRVLVVDDNTDAAAGVALLLERLGYRVTTAADGASALEAARDFEPEIVLLDIGMPGMNGYETARRLREQPGGDGRRVVAITGWSHDQARQEAAAAGFDQFLTKPVDVRTLSSVLSAGARS